MIEQRGSSPGPPTEQELVGRWSSAQAPWILHSWEGLGNLTERWIDIQARSKERFDARVLGLRISSESERQDHWLVASDRFDTYLAYRGMFKSRGQSLRWLARRFRDNPPAVLHAHFGHVAAVHCHLARSLRCPLVASFYGFDATESRIVESRSWRARYRRLFAEAEAFVVEGPAMADRVEALGCPREKLFVVRLPADASSLARVGRDVPDEFTVVAAGRLEEKKGFDTAVRAFARAFAGGAARLLIVGDGAEAPELRRLATQEGIAEQVEWAGRLPFEAFMNRVAGASVAVFPSRQARNGDSEGGAPVVLIETQWMGVPVLVSDHDDLPFVAAPEGSIVLPATDVAGWADALRALAESPDRAKRMGEAAQTFAREMHSPAANARARESVYTTAIELGVS